MTKSSRDDSISTETACKSPENALQSTDELADCFDRFMRPFLVRINPILHSTVWRGKHFAENHIIVMMAVRLASPLSPSELSRAVGMQKGSLTTIIRSLCQSGLIERQDTPGDERSYRLVITPAGLEFADHMAAQRSAGFRELFANLPEPRCQEIVSALDTLIDYLGQAEAS